MAAQLRVMIMSERITLSIALTIAFTPLRFE
jgi:hypothetical protein